MPTFAQTRKLRRIKVVEIGRKLSVLASEKVSRF